VIASQQFGGVVFVPTAYRFLRTILPVEIDHQIGELAYGQFLAQKRGQAPMQIFRILEWPIGMVTVGLDVGGMVIISGLLEQIGYLLFCIIHVSFGCFR